jgi:hypothetical protein
VCRSVCGVTLPTVTSSLARRTADAKPVFTEATGLPFHSTKWLLDIPNRDQRRRWASSRLGKGTGVCRLVLARFPIASLLKIPVFKSTNDLPSARKGEAVAIAPARVPV